MDEKHSTISKKESQTTIGASNERNTSLFETQNKKHQFRETQKPKFLVMHINIQTDKIKMI